MVWRAIFDTVKLPLQAAGLRLGQARSWMGRSSWRRARARTGHELAGAAADPAVPDYKKVVESVFLRRSIERQPLLVVLGDMEHFRSSPIWKSRRKARLFHCKALDEASDEELQADSTRFIRWAPRSKYIISEKERNRVPKNRSIINDTHFSCSKRNVQVNFEKVFGYRLSVDPLGETGSCVRKSDRNAVHDGRVILLPVAEIEPNVVYEKIVDNECGHDLVYDIRLPVFGPVSPYCIVKLREKSMRFGRTNVVSFLLPASSLLDSEEISLCRSFAKEIGLDFGELDVLRDGQSGKIYIVDANNTPVGPSQSLSAEERSHAIKLYAQHFSNSFFGTKY
ncbi:hypothetical protein [Reyranella sp.]|uniref:hypothetical protein n=1 Tax=Reyranella sp. TaxID=1929291 RepID=UPI003D11277A